MGPTVVIGGARAEYAQRLKRQLEMRMIGGNRSERRGSQCHAVVALLSCNHLDAVRLARGLGMVSDQLKQRIVSIRARVAQEHPTILHRHHRRQFISQLDRGGVGLATKHMAKAEFAHLALGSFNDFLVPVAKGSAPETCHALQIALALLVVDIGAFCTSHHHLLGQRWIGCRVNHRSHQLCSLTLGIL